MSNKLLVIFLLLNLSLISLAQSEAVNPPTVPGTTSLTNLISSIEAMKSDIKNLKTDMAQFKIQLSSELKSYQDKNYTFIILIILASLFAFKLFDRVLNFLMWKKRASQIIDFQTQVVGNLQAMNDLLLEMRGDIRVIQKQIKSKTIESDPVEEPKKSIWPQIRFLFLLTLLIVLVLYIWLIR